MHNKEGDKDSTFYDSFCSIDFWRRKCKALRKLDRMCIIDIKQQCIWRNSHTSNSLRPFTPIVDIFGGNVQTLNW